MLGAERKGPPRSVGLGPVGGGRKELNPVRAVVASSPIGFVRGAERRSKCEVEGRSHLAERALEEVAHGAFRGGRASGLPGVARASG